MFPTAATIPDALAIGLHWLFDTEQPHGAVVTQHGCAIVAEGRRINFMPLSTHRLPVVAVDVAEPRYGDTADGGRAVTNPLAPDELDRFTALLAALGEEVADTWNGHPSEFGSLGLTRPAHPTLLAAHRTYRAGCLDHPERDVFCECGWRNRVPSVGLDTTVTAAERGAGS